MVCRPLRRCSEPTVDLVTLKEYTWDSVSFWQGQGLCFSSFLTSLPPFLLSFLSVSLFQSIPGWPWTHCVTHDDLKLQILWPPPPRCWDCRCAPSSRFSLCWEWTQGARQALYHLSHVLGPEKFFLSCLFPVGSRVTQTDLDLTV